MIIPCDGLAALVVKGCICVVLPNIVLLILSWKNKDFRKSFKFICQIAPQKLIPKRIMKLAEKF